MAAEAALERCSSGMIVGLGSGSTAALFIQALGRALTDGKLRDIVGVPTSLQSDRIAREAGIPIAGFDEVESCDLTVDGADEVCPNLDLIKGLGGALLREKIVASNSRQLVIIVDAGKKVPKLGTRSPLPVEVTQFGHEVQHRFLAKLGGTPKLRCNPTGNAFVTDNANVIYDCHFEHGIDDTHALHRRLIEQVGVVEHGLFLKMADLVLVADETRVEVLERA